MGGGLAKLYPDFVNDTPIQMGLDTIIPVWEAGKELALRDPDGFFTERKIFTSIDSPPFGTDMLYGGVKFHKNTTTQRDALKPYFGVGDWTAWGYLGLTHDERAENLIHFTRPDSARLPGTGSA